MNEKELILKALAAISVKYVKKEIEVVEAVIEMVSEIVDTRFLEHKELLSVYMYAFGCLEIYRTVALNGGFITSSLSGVDTISSPASISRVIFTEVYSSTFISNVEDKNKFESEINMMCADLYKTALSHFLSNHNADFLFKNLRLQLLISEEEAEAIERYMRLLNELASCR
ncbi:hypothetical protein EB837_09805 [Kluyvera ascorbata]|uniref:Uncharacterized protein n=1 Tax=Kluyvera ascorbata TaxID=51288 RepID=A0A3N2S502_9ENTR|nr:hypothetical protein [Kluyvera ascorbata]ROU14756.1 hypothetical protein EB837_09805 [Kluyvera ascorbata]HED1307288.1 hypothetical protein [Kluyvera ascorbata]